MEKKNESKKGLVAAMSGFEKAVEKGMVEQSNVIKADRVKAEAKKAEEKKTQREKEAHEKKAAEKKAKAEKKSAPKVKKESKPGVLAEIKAFIISKGKGVFTKEQILKHLVKKFPERKEEQMQATINVQMPTRICVSGELKIEKVEGGYVNKKTAK